MLCGLFCFSQLPASDTGKERERDKGGREGGKKERRKEKEIAEGREKGKGTVERMKEVFAGGNQGWESDQAVRAAEASWPASCWLALAGLPSKSSLQRLPWQRELQKTIFTFLLQTQPHSPKLILKVSSNLLRKESKSETQFTSHFIPLKENHFLEQMIYGSENHLLSHPASPLLQLASYLVLLPFVNL